MIQAIPRQAYVLIAGAALAFGASFANIAVFLITGTSISHLTGDISKLSIDIIAATPSHWHDLMHVLTATLSFIAGAMASGYFIHHPTLNINRPYGRTIIGIGLSFILAYKVLARFPILAIASAAFGCGFQNAMATHYRGLILRTTHLTGMLTDFGVNFGMRLRHRHIPTWKIMIPAILTVAFILGALASAYLHLRHHASPLLIAGNAYIIAGVVWHFVKHFGRS